MPMITRGWPESKANIIPAIAVDTSVSGIPIRLLVLLAKAKKENGYQINVALMSHFSKPTKYKYS